MQPKPEIHKSNQNNYSNNKQQNKVGSEIKIPQFTYMTMEERCYCCWKKGHKSPQCRLKDVIPKEKWAIRKAAQESHNFFQEGSKQLSETSSITSASNSKNNVNESKANKIACANTHLVMASTTSMQNKILLDSDSTTTVFCNEDYCDTIKSSETVEIKKMVEPCLWMKVVWYLT